MAAKRNADGRYISRSAMTVPVVNNRLAAGRKVSIAAPRQKLTKRFSFTLISAATVTAATAIHANQSVKLPLASGICENE